MSANDLMIKALIVTTILSVVLVSYLLWVSSQERYTTIYIYPDYSNYVKPGSVVKFRYGLYCHEGQETNYTIKIYLGNELIKTKKVVLKNDERWEENESVYVPSDVSLPTKIRIVAETESDAYEVYFWIKEKSR